MFQQLKNKKIAVCTLGCKVNQYESDCMMDMLAACGCELMPFEERADIYIVNTCAVTNMAERKSRQMLHRAKKTNPQAIIVAVGCYVQAQPDAVAADVSVDLVIGNNRKKDIAKLLEEYLRGCEHAGGEADTEADTEKSAGMETVAGTDLPAEKETESAAGTDGSECMNSATVHVVDIAQTKEYESMTLSVPHEHTRAYVKVQDGCNNFCSYCIIPYTRGRIRSRATGEVVSEVTELVKNGIREVVLTGINLSSYQEENSGDLLDLILAVAKIPDLRRIRLGSLEPRVITERFLKGISNEPKVCPHFHLSLQSACNETLLRMNRHYTIEEYAEKCALIRAYYDRPAITTDIIVGFPGETEEEFSITEQNLEKLALYEMHIFKYSRRKNTVADRMPNQVADAVKNARSNRLLAMTARQKEAYEETFRGQRLSVLVEEIVSDGTKSYMKGHTDRYILVEKEIEGKDSRELVNRLVDVVF